MFQTLCEVRKRYGGTYVSLFEDGTTIPWRVLTLDEFVHYSIDQARGVIPAAILEDEIFRKCVLDPVTIQSMDRMPAGIVTTVSGQIWKHSGPHGPAQVNEDLDTARILNRLPEISFLNELVNQVIIAYPAYTPDDLYKMDYQTFLSRAALAEERLLRAGVVEEPFIAYSPEQLEQPDPNIVSIEERKRIVDEYIAKQTGTKTPPHAGPLDNTPPPREERLPNIHEYRQQVKEHGVSYQAPRPPPIGKDIARDKWWKISPVLEAPRKVPLHFAADNVAAAEGMSGWDKVDLPIIRAKMIEDAQEIYKDLIEEVERRQPKK
jgi:hypothetical protein